MAALTVAQYGPPIRWGNAAGKAIIAESWRITGPSLAGDTGTLVSTNISNFIAVIGSSGVHHTAVTDTEAGVSVAITAPVAVAAANFSEILLIGKARDVSS